MSTVGGVYRRETMLAGRIATLSGVSVVSRVALVVTLLEHSESLAARVPPIPR